MSKLRIKEVIKERGTSIEAISKKIGVNASAISQSINGNPTVERLRQIADALGVTVPELFCSSEVTGFIKSSGVVYEIRSRGDLVMLLDKIPVEE